MPLREYQQAACDAALAFMRTSISPCLIDAAPASGKSHIIAYIATELHRISGGKRILCLAPNAKLVLQNREKMQLTGTPSSIFSASAGAKSTRHPMVLATPGTVVNAISRFANGDYCAVVVDEAHGMTPTIRSIIEAMRLQNPNLRVLGLTGTPYVLGKGYIFRAWPDGRVNGDDVSREPYFTKCVYQVSAREMLDAKYITPMRIGAIHAGAYDTSALELLPNGTPTLDSIEAAFVGHGRKTATIVADVVQAAQARQGGVMLFASTIPHAREILASLPPENAVMVTGDMDPKAEKAAVKAYREHKKRYVVSVGKMTTGFDSPWTEIIATLRYTESATLLTQILGRAWRLYDGKQNSLWLDYAGNQERHFPDGDIYKPQVKAGKAPGAGLGIEAECPTCAYVNTFTGNPDMADYKLDVHGYCLDVWGETVLTDFGPMSGHFGRRCNGLLRQGAEHVRCNYRWSGKPCPACEEINDIAARRCYVCKAEIVDPNTVLVAEFKALKRDPTQPQTDEVLEFTRIPSVSRAGKPIVRADWRTPHRHFSTWHQSEATWPKARTDWERFDAATAEGAPATVSYVKNMDDGFFRILAYNEPADIMEMVA